MAYSGYPQAYPHAYPPDPPTYSQTPSAYPQPPPPAYPYPPPAYPQPPPPAYPQPPPAYLQAPLVPATYLYTPLPYLQAPPMYPHVNPRLQKPKRSRLAGLGLKVGMIGVACAITGGVTGVEHMIYDAFVGDDEDGFET